MTHLAAPAEWSPTMNLESLLAQYNLLELEGGDAHERARRGLAFEKLLAELFRSQNIYMTAPFRITGEQIDGAFEYKGWTYLVEAKWQGAKKSTDALYAFQGKPDRRIEGTRGLFISVSGFHHTSVERFDRGRKPNTLLWDGEHIKAVLNGLVTVPELLDLSLRFAAERGELFVPLQRLLASRDSSLFADALAACAAQVEAEIASAVGKKFIPQLYVERDVQEQIEDLLHPERRGEKALDELRRVQPRGFRGRRKLKKLLDRGPGSGLSGILSEARGLRLEALPVGSTLRTLLMTLPAELNGRMHVINARAGTGKTNLLCHLAKHYARQQPVIFLTGRSGVTERTSIKELIEAKLGRYLAGALPKEGLFERLVSAAEKQGMRVTLFLDAINEHGDLELLSQSIAHFLLEVKGRPVTILAACRDVYWPFFDTSLWPAAQWSVFKVEFDVFSRREAPRAVSAYFDFYNIDVRLSAEAREKLSHPLILRFFCETYGDPASAQKISLPEVSDIRLKDLFGDYLDRKLELIRHTAPRKRRTSREVEDYLFTLAGQMRRAKSRAVSREDVPRVTSHADMESPASVYVAILAEDIIIEEEPDKENRSINVVFTYDEFMEYMIARSMLGSCDPSDAAAVQALAEECQGAAVSFPTFVGVFEYIAILLREDYGVPVWEYIESGAVNFGVAAARAVRKLRPQFVGDAELEYLGRAVASPAREVRDAAAKSVAQIAAGKKYGGRQRKYAVGLLRDLLTHSDDLLLRMTAIRPFEEPEVASIDATARAIARWWESRKEEMKGKKIVWTDDSTDTLELCQMLLEREGFTNFYTEADTLKALEIIEREKPDLILTDQLKPGMTGAELARIIKSRPALARTPIVLASALRREEIDSELFSHFLQKPWDISEVLAVVRALLAGKFNPE
ncbi:MAG TPA: response regulator [Pyrinomonadaceae bacterium]